MGDFNATQCREEEGILEKGRNDIGSFRYLNYLIGVIKSAKVRYK